MNISSSTSQFDVAKMATAAHVLHKLWVGRCCATYDNKPMRARQICIRVIHKVKLIMLLHTPKRPSTKFQHLRLELLGLTRKHVKVKIKNVKENESNIKLAVFGPIRTMPRFEFGPVQDLNNSGRN